MHNEQLVGFTTGQLAFSPSCASAGEDDSGKERIFYGATNGFVYEMNRGSTADGAPIESFVKIFYINSRSPEVRKRYRRMTLEMSLELYASLRFQAEFAYGEPDTEPHVSSTSEGIQVSGVFGGGIWDVGNWDEIAWDGQDVVRPSLSISGTGINLSMNFYSNSTLDFGHVLSGAVIHYTARRLQRT